MQNEFIIALESLDLKAVKKVSKSDLHNHSMMGGRLSQLELFTGKKLEKFVGGKSGVQGINEWLKNVYRPLLQMPGIFKAAIDAAFKQAVSDGVTVLEMSLDVDIGRKLGMTPQQIRDILIDSHKSIAPDIAFRPELGFSRAIPLRTLLACFEPWDSLGFFRSIDLYDAEDLQPVENFRELYRYARNRGMKCKAHAGESGDAESVRKTAETLELDAVQHGIGASDSADVMKWLALNDIVLNVCPQSNIALKRSKSYRAHPIRVLFDHGVKVTVNTDDVMLFNAGNSEQYLRLFKSGLFSAEELDTVRMNGLGQWNNL